MSRIVIFRSDSDNVTQKKPLSFFKIFNPNWVNHEFSSHIPEVWPEPRRQIGGTCGLYALYIGLLYFLLNSGLKTDEIPLPVNESGDIRKKRETTLFSLARQTDLTKAGEILNIHYFGVLLAQLGIPPKNAIQSNPEYFLHDLCKQLDENNTVIVSCDLESDSNFPGVSGGSRAHWILIFGYFYSNDTLFFLTTHLGSYYLISAEDLLKSNNQYPGLLYPKCEAFGSIVSTDRNRFMGHFMSSQEVIALQSKAPTTPKVTKIPPTTLDQFFCTMFPIPASCKKTPSAPAPEKEEAFTILS